MKLTATSVFSMLLVFVFIPPQGANGDVLIFYAADFKAAASNSSRIMRQYHSQVKRWIIIPLPPSTDNEWPVWKSKPPFDLSEIMIFAHCSAEVGRVHGSDPDHWARYITATFRENQGNSRQLGIVFFSCGAGRRTAQGAYDSFVDDFARDLQGSITVPFDVEGPVGNMWVNAGPCTLPGNCGIVCNIDGDACYSCGNQLKLHFTTPWNNASNYVTGIRKITDCRTSLRWTGNADLTLESQWTLAVGGQALYHVPTPKSYPLGTARAPE